MNPKKYKDIVYQIIGAAMEVHNQMGISARKIYRASDMPSSKTPMSVSSLTKIWNPSIQNNISVPFMFHLWSFMLIK